MVGVDTAGTERSSVHTQGIARLVSRVVGDAEAIPKCAGRVARLLEEQFILDGWPVKRIYGCESVLSNQYAVGRPIVREAARILEARGTAQMRRGRGGGLELATPQAERLYEAIGTYCFMRGVTREHLDSARLVLDRIAASVAAERGACGGFLPLLNNARLDGRGLSRDVRRQLIMAAENTVVTFFSDCLDQLSEAFRPECPSDESRNAGNLRKCVDRLVDAIGRGDLQGAAIWASATSKRCDVGPFSASSAASGLSAGQHTQDALRRTRAGQIVLNLVKHVGPGQWTDGYNLGHEFKLCERYQVDRSVLRQAIRILEAAETAKSLPGRGHGLVACSPGPASTSRLICCHFAAHGVGFHQSLEAFKWLGMEMVGLAARRKGEEGLARISHAIAAMRDRSGIVLTSEIIALEEWLFALAANPVLDLFLRSAKAFPTWGMRGDLPVPDDALRDFVDCSAEVTAAIAAHDPRAAAAAQRNKFARLNRHVGRTLKNCRGERLAEAAWCRPGGVFVP